MLTAIWENSTEYLPSPICVLFEYFDSTGRMAGGWTRTVPVFCLVEWPVRQELIPLILHHIRMGSKTLSNEWQAYRRALPAFGSRHYTVNYSVAYVNAETGCNTQDFERAWRSYKETIRRLWGESHLIRWGKCLLREHLIVIQCNEWLGQKTL